MRILARGLLLAAGADAAGFLLLTVTMVAKGYGSHDIGTGAAVWLLSVPILLILAGLAAALPWVISGRPDDG